MAGESAPYRMLVLLEEPLEENIETLTRDGDVKEVNEHNVEKGETQSKSHEFVDELILPFNVDELDMLNEWFDKFDDEVCIPNEGHIKYEITSDGLIVLMLDKEIEHVVSKVKEFVSANQMLASDEEEQEYQKSAETGF
ncbi:hypothetical protein TPHA_0I00190 [Tetrapisispora phaffii CBS 4417]|uniref:Uncharacterized protein n=1 Tax=Tetrapisispora phaffii (strain ATCC 24235 / CBS 4417 / NBRC 1672 / NRRL Y-8282 / UCD 70-5) TaxID=1071381 RepID=G8BX98_TETPH|nr:hypothetical protein TPHA_0I00190 [Tetrapisispora phaffii CBS 4417]CCE64526.1 hypothetical protein TPHA_0I00190 [Tetrapisispora phaffii CBS 4417]